MTLFGIRDSHTMDRDEWPIKYKDIYDGLLQTTLPSGGRIAKQSVLRRLQRSSRMVTQQDYLVVN